MTTTAPATQTPPKFGFGRGWLPTAITFACAAFVLVIAIVFVEQLVRTSLPAWNQAGPAFVYHSVWDPVSGEFGALPFIFGTLVSSGLALLIAVPLGLGAAIFLSELARPGISAALAFLVELLAAVPSVIIGLLGIFVLIPGLRAVVPWLQSTFPGAPLFSGAFYGVSLLAAGLILAIMVLPFIVSVSREMLLAVPTEQREAALALGATKWESTWQVVVPFARSGIMASIFLALARALGETMAVTMVIGNTPQISSSLLAPGYSLTSVLANEFAEATDANHLSALVGLGLILFILAILINALARILIRLTANAGEAR